MQQYEYLVQFDNGYNEKGIINIPLKGNDPQVVVNEFSKIAEVQDIALTSLIVNTGTQNNTWVGYKDPQDSILVNQLWTDHRYLTVMDIPLIAGRDFPDRLPGEGENIMLVNETLIDQLGFENPHDAIGETLRNFGGEWVIRGVVRDFQYQDAHESMTGVLIKFRPDRARHASIRFESAYPQDLMRKMESTWKVVDNVVHVFDAELFEDQLRDSYSGLTKMANVIGFLAVLAISIACLGLMGMAVYTAETRLREVGIRKVMGATEKGLVYLLSKGFLKLLLISSLIAVAFTFTIINKVMLPSMANKAIPGVTEFGLGVVLLFLLGGIIIGSQTWRASRANPADTLRQE